MRLPCLYQDKTLKIATDILHYTGTNPRERKKIEVEQEAWRSIDALFAKERKAFQNELVEKNKTIQEMANENERIQKEKDKEIEELKKDLAKDNMAHNRGSTVVLHLQILSQNFSK